MADNRPQEMLNYYAKNNSIPVMDSLLMNRQIIKSGMGYDTTTDPVIGNRYDTVNSIGRITAVEDKAVTISPDSGFVIPGDPVIAINADVNFGIGRYYYQDGYGEEKPTLIKNWEIFNGIVSEPEEPEEPDPENPE